MIKFDHRDTPEATRLRSLFAEEELAAARLGRVRQQLARASSAYSLARGERVTLPKAELRREVMGA